MVGWLTGLAMLGTIVASFLLFEFRGFARDQGLEVRWSSRSFSREREFLRALANRPGRPPVGRRARLFLRLELVAWIVQALSLAAFLWAVVERF